MRSKTQLALLQLLAAATAAACVAGVASAADGTDGGTDAANRTTPTVVLNGERLSLPLAPAIIRGTTFVPLRGVFERQGAEVVWDPDARAVRAEKGTARLTYVIGEAQAEWNGQRLSLPLPGYIENGTAMVPLRLISEALGGIVTWNGETGTIAITAAVAEAAVEWGVNLRAGPGVGHDILRMLEKGEFVGVLREADDNWLLVQAGDGAIGYISAGPKYTDFGAMKAADRLIAYGETFLGAPYEFGASAKQTDTFDCSSLVKHLFREVFEVDLPRTSYDQAKEGKEVEPEELRKGDLLFFTARGLPIGHVAIYAGDGKMLHTYSTKNGVEFSDFDGQWKKRFVAARRVY